MSELIRATSTRSWSLSRPLSERVADAEEVKPARSACTTELCAWLRQRTLLRLRRIALRLGGAQSGSGDVIVRRQQFIHMVLPSISKNSGVSGKTPRLRN